MAGMCGWSSTHNKILFHVTSILNFSSYNKECFDNITCDKNMCAFIMIFDPFLHQYQCFQKDRRQPEGTNILLYLLLLLETKILVC